MDGVVCLNCNSFIPPAPGSCPGCGREISLQGEGKNVIDQLSPDCLIHRYEGSDMLEPAVLIKEGKTNMKVATKLREYSSPVTVPKHKVYVFDHETLAAVQALRNERTATIHRFDQMIRIHWNNLRPYPR